MAVTALYNGKTEERDVDGITSIRTYSGTYAECTAYGQSYQIGANYPLGT